MSLRLLPAIIMDDEDDDGNFTKWMSSYWGHGAEGRGGGGGGGHLRERKRSFRRPAKNRVDRRASLPTVSQLDAMKLNRLHAATTASHAKSREDKGEVKPHQRARRTSSDDNGRSKSAVPESRIGTIPELTESFQKRLCLQDKCTPSQNGDVKVCLRCHDNVYKNGAGLQEPHCAHTFHKEAARRSEPCGPRSGSETAATCMVRRLLSDRRRSADEVGAVTPEKQQQQQQPFRRQLSLRRHR